MSNETTIRKPQSAVEQWLELIYSGIGGGGSIAEALDDIAVELARREGLDYSNLSGVKFYYNADSEIDLRSLDTSNFTDFYGMFQHCDHITSLDLSRFNTSNVTTMGYMFYFCNKLTSLDLSSFDTSKVAQMNRMFERCSALTSLNLQSFTTPVCESMSYFIQTATALKDLIWAIDSETVQPMPTADSLDKVNGTVPSDLSIYVRDSLVDSYKAATNWAKYASLIKPISELPQALQELYNIDPSDYE